MMSLFPTIIIFLLGSTYATPVVPNALSANVVCLSNNVILRALRDPAHTAEASSFCSSFIRSTTSTTVTAAATRIIATLTITPEPVVVTNTVTTFITTTAGVGPILKRSIPGKRQIKAIPSFLSKFKEGPISSACSCIVTAGTTTITSTNTRTQDGTLTTTVPASTQTTIETITQTVTQTPSICSVNLPIVTNGNFDAGDAPWSYGDNTPVDDSGREPADPSGFRAFITCFDFTQNAILSQTISTCPGVVYSYFFNYQFNPTGDQLLSVTYAGASITNIPALSTRIGTASGSFTATASSGALEFTFDCGRSLEGRVRIDDVIIAPNT